jgi:hypothetical protein
MDPKRGRPFCKIMLKFHNYEVDDDDGGGGGGDDDDNNNNNNNNKVK